MNTSKMQDRRVWMGGGCVAAALILAAGYFLLISPELSSAKQARSQAQATQLQNQTLAANNAKLAAQFRGIATLRGTLAKALEALPPISGLPAFTQEVTHAAVAQRVTLTSITVSAATPVTATTAATSTPTDSSGAATPTPTPTSTTTGATTGTDTTTGTGTGTSGQFSFPITLTTTGSTPHQLAFVKALEDGPRSALITSSQLTATGSDQKAADTDTTMTTQLTIFSAPMSAGRLAQLKTLLGLHR